MVITQIPFWERESAHNIIIAFVILAITFVTVIIVRKILNKFFKVSSQHIKTDPTHYRFFQHLITALITIIGIGISIYVIPALRTLSVSLFAGAGILAVVIGFASQAAFSNIISGIFIVIFKPFRVNDRITVAEHSGIVEDITLRHTVIRNFENRMIVIPNSVISNQTIINSNLLEDKTCRFLEFGISYDSNIDLAFEIIRDEAIKHPGFYDNRSEEQKINNDHPIAVRVISLGEYTVNIRANVWALDPATAFAMGCDLLKLIKERFDREGIEIPFPYRTIVFKKDIDANNKFINPDA